MDSFFIRRAEIADAAGIAAVKYLGWQNTYKGIIRDDFLTAMSLPQLEKKWQKNLVPGASRSTTDVLVNNNNEEIAGYITYGKNPNEQYKAEAEIFAFYVLKKHHGKGLGKQLFEHAVAQLKHAGNKSIYLLVITGNPAVGFYRKYKPKEELPVITHIGGVDYNEIVMVWHFE
jgi:ribosomal protein S18 acetylase RimI-like enzyme